MGTKDQGGAPCLGRVKWALKADVLRQWVLRQVNEAVWVAAATAATPTAVVGCYYYSTKLVWQVWIKG